MRTLVATVLYNSKGKEIFCTAKKVNDQHLKYLREANRQDLEAVGFVFIKILSLEYPNVRGYAVFFEGHIDDIMPALKTMAYNYKED